MPSRLLVVLVTMLLALVLDQSHAVPASTQRPSALRKGNKPTDVEHSQSPSLSVQNKKICRNNGQECICGKWIYNGQTQECQNGRVVCIKKTVTGHAVYDRNAKSRVTERSSGANIVDQSVTEDNATPRKTRTCRKREGVLECQCGPQKVFYDKEKAGCYKGEVLQRSPGCEPDLSIAEEQIPFALEQEPPVSNISVTVFQHFSTRKADLSMMPERIPDEILRDINNTLHAIFVTTDENMDGFMSLQEFQSFLGELHLEMPSEVVLNVFNEISARASEITFQKFYEYYRMMLQGEKKTHTEAEMDLLVAFLEADREGRCELGGISQFINKRWESFNYFARNGTAGKLVMVGGETGVDVLPGEYLLHELTTSPSLPQQNREPKYTKIFNVRWTNSSKPENESGTLLFPKQFVDIRLPVEWATDEALAYYGCRLAHKSVLRVSLFHRHVIQNFTYYDNYYRDHVRGKAGLERHEFSHLDCPYQENNGFFVLAKFADKMETELHVTAFKVPVNHTIYVPPLTIHSNDYLRGTWRTMLSDARHIDHVRLERERYDGEVDQVAFDFLH